jgi:hypothetical protein
MMRTSTWIAPALLAAAVLAACSDGTGASKAGPPARVDLLSGDQQTAPAGSELPQPLVVKVTDAKGKPVSGQPVAFVVTAGGGHVFAGSTVTNAAGEARERWTLGPVAGDSQRVEARAVDQATGAKLVFATFRAVATPGAAATLSVANPGPGTGTVGQPQSDSVTVLVKDAHGNPVPGVQVTWTATDGGSASPAASLTRADGTTRALWTLGTHAGLQTLAASAAGVATPAGVGATASAGPAASVTISPAPLSIVVGQQVTLTANVVDAYGNPTSAVITWGSTNPAVATATAGTVRGIGAGSAQVTASVTGATPGSAGVTVTRPTIQSLSAGSNDLGVCALDTSGNAFCWGYAYGAGVAANASERPLLIGGGLQFARVSTTGSTSCGLAAGQAYCWGTVAPGTLTPVAATPRPVGGGRSFTDFVTGRPWPNTSTPVTNSFCGISGGTLYCWPAQDLVSGAPQPLAQGTAFTGLAGGAHLCALDAAGVPWCWGMNDDLQLGRDKTNCVSLPSDALIYGCPAPAPIASGQSFAAVRTGDRDTCARAQDGTWSCWGQADNNVLLQPEPLACEYHPMAFRYYATCTSTPVPISTSPALVSLVPGSSSICGLTAGGAAYCWGANGHGQLGNGTTSSSATPVAVSGGHSFVSLVAGGGFYCGLDGAGEVWCWGYNGNGQLGNGGTADSAIPVAVF